jgi:tyrosine-protein phosphatase SIW14
MQAKRLLAFALAALAPAACATYSPQRAPTHATDGRTFALRDSGLPMDNVARIDEGVWRGSAPGASGMRALKSAGFRTVIDLRSGGDDKRLGEAVGLNVVEIPLHAAVTCDPPSEEQVRRFLDVVSDPANRPVYVHCAYGRDRTGVMCALYRMEVCGWTREEAMEEMRAFGFRTWYQDFLSFLTDYEPCGRYTRAQDEPAGR